MQLRRTTPQNVEAAGRRSGLLMHALRELAEKQMILERREHLKRTLSADKRPKFLKDLRLTPTWMRLIFRELADEDP